MEPEAFRAHNRVFAVSIFPGQDCRLKLRLGISSRNAKVSTFDGTAEPGKGFVSEGLERGGVGFGWRGEVGEVVDLEVIGDRHRDGVPLGADAFQKGPQAGILGRVSLNKGHERFTAVQGKDGAMEGRGDDEGGVEEEVDELRRRGRLIHGGVWLAKILLASVEVDDVQPERLGHAVHHAIGLRVRVDHVGHDVDKQVRAFGATARLLRQCGPLGAVEQERGVAASRGRLSRQAANQCDARFLAHRECIIIQERRAITLLQLRRQGGDGEAGSIGNLAHGFATFGWHETQKVGGIRAGLLRVEGLIGPRDIDIGLGRVVRHLREALIRARQMQLLAQEMVVDSVAPQVDESSDGPTHERDGLARRFVQGAGLSHIVNGEAPVPQETLDGRA